MKTSKIGVIGSGDVGKVLAAGFKKHGHDVTIASREGNKLGEWSAQSGVPEATFAEVAASSDILVLAVLGRVAEDAVRLAGVDNLAGKTILDATNPIAAAAPVNGVLQFFTGPNDSLMERLQKLAPAANFVKAFSCVGNPVMIDPSFAAGRPTMFICGNSADAKAETTRLLDQLGWEAADMGAVESARAIEPLCQLWCILGFTGNEWTHAFKLLHR